MEIVTKAAWASLGLLHVVPAAVLFVPSLTSRLYGIEPNGDIGILIVHRGAMFAAVAIAAFYALFDPNARRLAAVVVAVSMVGFLVVYVRAGLPDGSLRSIAVVDLCGLLPLVLVGWQAWRD